ncbi:hypothetical protein TNCT6_66020 [Streptomyces sp. 6-11-2]|nr:hypothetical protein TNCT6_66020 [Streptomyces sp. 6-11-2]
MPAAADVLLDPVNPQLPDRVAVAGHPPARNRVLVQHHIGRRLFGGQISEGAIRQALFPDGPLPCGSWRRRGRRPPRSPLDYRPDVMYSS